MKRARIQVDFNEMVDDDLVMLSRVDACVDSLGNVINLVEGMKVYLYMEDGDLDGTPDNVMADGVVARNRYPDNKWAAQVKWWCKIDRDTFHHESDEAEE